jgi:predicted MFS family arabinose efflux permease
MFNLAALFNPFGYRKDIRAFALGGIAIGLTYSIYKKKPIGKVIGFGLLGWAAGFGTGAVLSRAGIKIMQDTPTTATPKEDKPTK